MIENEGGRREGSSVWRGAAFRPDLDGEFACVVYVFFLEEGILVLSTDHSKVHDAEFYWM